MNAPPLTDQSEGKEETMELPITDPQDTPQRRAMYTLPIEAPGVSDIGETVEDTVSDHFYAAYEAAERSGGLTPCYVLRYGSDDLDALDEDVASVLDQEMHRRGSNAIEVVVIPRG